MFTDTHRIVEGVATTPERNKHGYAVAMSGGEWDLPIPLLLGHDWSKVIGEVCDITATKDAIRFTARVANAALPDINDIWARIISGELAGISADNSHLGEVKSVNGTPCYHRWRMCEVSVSERGANPSARILSVCERIGDTEIVHREAGVRAAPVFPLRSTPDIADREVIHREATLQDDLAARIAALEARPTMAYRGVWNPDTQFNEGNVVTSKGSMWYCLRSTRSAPPSEDWQLCVKKGRDGKYDPDGLGRK